MSLAKELTDSRNSPVTESNACILETQEHLFHKVQLRLCSFESEDTVALAVGFLALLDAVLHPVEHCCHELCHHPDHS
ncbi:hypothetical protein E2C01_014564 [Portunus trituberculatus]|uniref:Uncharacterized protein n=1 Tax=Portunus trituberculatus TaxID=210409 RepID=A0A5B7DKU7_PORTR|nr:hypothetical protein [Portunus trituberculatus]